MFDRFTDQAKRAMSQSRQEALRLRDEVINPYHMLLALLRRPEPSIVALLTAVGAEPGALLAKVEQAVHPGNAGDMPINQLPFTPSAKHALERMMALASNLEHSLDVDLLLVAIVDVARPPLSEAIASAGVDRAALIEALEAQAGGREAPMEPFTLTEAQSILTHLMDMLHAWADAASTAGRADASMLLAELRGTVRQTLEKLGSLPS
jgi:ATP-dependent Clp protease ATP-binding subunit ClpA